jgi:hypothetical protein
MTNKALSIDDIGKNNPYENTPILTREEALDAIARAALNKAELMWGESRMSSRLTIDDRVYGAVYSTLKLLQEGVEGRIPPFDLVPQLPLDEATTEPTIPVRREEKIVLGGWPQDPISLAATPTDPVSLTSTYADIYDSFRERLAASARDLFRD